MTRRFWTRAPVKVLGTFALALLWSRPARGDAIDLVWFLTRVSTSRRSALHIALLATILLGLNYTLNLIVIAIPAVGTARMRRVAKDMVGFTVIAQLGDRLGMVVCAGVVILVRILAHAGTTLKDLRSIGLWSIGSNFLVSGLFIWLLARYYLVGRWQVSKRRGVTIAAIAAVVTNPAWAIVASPLLP